MGKMKQREHDFSAKLRQMSVIDGLKEYISWRRSLLTDEAAPNPPPIGPVSINLDLTSACNFACPHCVDSGIINTGKALTTEEIMQSVDLLAQHGLKSVILIGGGEPTLHKDFVPILRHIKEKGLQAGIVTNGTRLDKVAEAADVFEEKDWLRLSLDAATQETFEALHCPRQETELTSILKNASEIKKANPALSLGFSFVIVWDGIMIKDHKQAPNVTEMADAVKLAIQYHFDFISFKPCLVRLSDSQKESFLDHTRPEQEEAIRRTIQENLEAAREAAGGQINILPSVNLSALLKGEVVELKNQPKTCHMQFFRTVLTPTGIFHCPAFRGVDTARIGEAQGYTDEELFETTQTQLADSIETFDAHRECEVVGCFYHHANAWIEAFIHSDRSVEELESLDDDNFFL